MSEGAQEDGQGQAKSFQDIANQGNENQGNENQESESENKESSTNTNGQEQDNKWFWDEGVTGQGDKPEWLKPRYKSVSDQAKAYGELEKKLGEFKGAPKDGYKIEEIEGLNKDDPMISHFMDTFKELNLSQQGFERVVQEYLQLENHKVESNLDEELKKLGSNANDRVQQTFRWIDGTFKDDVSETIKSWMVSAKDIEAVEAFRAAMPKSAMPTFEQTYQQPDYESVKELTVEKQNNWSKYKEDENYRNAWQRRFQLAYKREEALKKK